MERKDVIDKTRKYGEVVRQKYIPLADERKHDELMNQIMAPRNPMARGLGHAGIDNSTVTTKRSQYDSYALYAALPEVTIAKMVVQ